MTVLSQLKAIAARSHPTLVQDMIGAFSLFVILGVGLHLPSYL
jgi:hypothetical protein